MTTENNRILSANCEQPSCNISRDGKCIENHETPLVNCPFYLQVSSPSSQVEANTHQAGRGLPLDSGRDLKGEPVHGIDAEAILKKSLTRLIVIAGSPESGKTTLVASLYEQFQQGEFATYMFRSSQTLVGFERRCQLSRINSERTYPDTPRTKLEDTLRYLHLEICKQGINNTPTSLLFADINGERFEALQRYANEAAKVIPFRRADHFVLLLDSEKLLDLNRRHQEKSKAIMLLRRLNEANILGKENYVHILFSKWDTVQSETDKIRQEECREYKKVVQREFQQGFADRFGRLEFAEIAARPNQGRPFGLDTLLTYWVQNTPYQERQWHTPIKRPTDLKDCWQFFASEDMK